MGEWKGYLSEKPLGIKALWIGLQKFYSMMHAYLPNCVYTVVVIQGAFFVFFPSTLD